MTEKEFRPKYSIILWGITIIYLGSFAFLIIGMVISGADFLSVLPYAGMIIFFIAAFSWGFFKSLLFFEDHLVIEKYIWPGKVIYYKDINFIGTRMVGAKKGKIYFKYVDNFDAALDIFNQYTDQGIIDAPMVSEVAINKRTLAQRASTPAAVILIAIIFIGNFVLKLDFNFLDKVNILLVGFPVYGAVYLYMKWQQGR